MSRTASQIAADVLLKVAEEYDAYGNLVPPPFPALNTGIGAVLGGLGGQYVFPSPEAKAFRELAEKVPKDTDVWQKVLSRKGGDKVVSFKGPPEIVRKFYQNQALRSNAIRMLGGIGAGALTGYGLSQLLGDD